MAKNDKNSQRGKLGELDVAQAFVEAGCVVNFLSFMDVGLDLHVQPPSTLSTPDPTHSEWEMSGRAFHVQVKSTTKDELPSIARSTARAWVVGAQVGTPTIVIGVIVGDGGAAHLRLFDPLLIKGYADKSSGESFKIPVARGEQVGREALLNRVTDWMKKGAFYLSDNLGFNWPKDAQSVSKSAIELVANLSVIHESTFSSPSMSGASQQYEETSERLARAYLHGAYGDGRERDGASQFIADAQERAVMSVIEGSAPKQEIWSSWIAPLATVCPMRDRLDALEYLADICFEYGRTSRRLGVL